MPLHFLEVWNNMKRRALILGSLALSASLLLSACGLLSGRFRLFRGRGFLCRCFFRGFRRERPADRLCRCFSDGDPERDRRAVQDRGPQRGAGLQL